MINRFSSRRKPLDASFLAPRLEGASSYDRIAGYFRSSLLEVAGEALEKIDGTVRIVCNSDLTGQDVATAKAAHQALRREWCAGKPEAESLEPVKKDRFARLFDLLVSRKLLVRVLPNQAFGLIHGKAGVITTASGCKTSFLGSINETANAWRGNYELLWEDDSPEAVTWVQEEFEALWNHPQATELSQFIIEDIGRISKRTEYRNLDEWRRDPQEAAPIVELPVFRQEAGLWEHQKHFVHLAFNAHQKKQGARFVLADMVGLGKTVQLAVAAQLMALAGSRPILVLAPKTLVRQWQGELRDLLDMPSAIWTGRQWIDENNIEYPIVGAAGILCCPRRVGIVSQGLITHESEICQHLLSRNWECVIVDEAHRARRKNLGPDKEGESAEPNNLMRFLLKLAPKAHSLLLATATPVQMYPIEAWDLLSILSQERESVLGNIWSRWRKADATLKMVLEEETLPQDDHEIWEWVRNPLPYAEEGRNFHILRSALRLTEDTIIPPADVWQKLSRPDQERIRRLRPTFVSDHNPFIRHIIRRTRDFLEKTIDEETGEPYLQPVKVQLFGEEPQEAITLPVYLKDAYSHAEEFCRLLGSRVKGGGFLKTLLLRRVGSTIRAGWETARRMYGTWGEAIESEDDDETDQPEDVSEMKNLSSEERNVLHQFILSLEANQDRDPKYAAVKKLLVEKQWLELDRKSVV